MRDPSYELLLVLFTDGPCIKYGCHNFLCLVNKTSPVLVRLVDMLIIFMTHEQCTVTAWLHLAYL